MFYSSVLTCPLQANKLAESGDFKGAQELLRKAYSSLDTSIWIGDNFSKSLGMELKEMMERMANEKVHICPSFTLKSQFFFWKLGL